MKHLIDLEILSPTFSEMLYPRGHNWSLGQPSSGDPSDPLLFEDLVCAVAQPFVLMRRVSVPEPSTVVKMRTRTYFPLRSRLVRTGGADMLPL